MDITDTIVAISTPLGEGGIGIVRISGSRAILIAAAMLEFPSGPELNKLASHCMRLCRAVNPKTKEELDQVLVCVMRAPHTYTREDVVEINCHGGIMPLQATLDAAVEAGARLAEPGEFTKRAFLNGRIDLAQAEAVIDVIRSKTKESLQLAMGQLEGQLSQKVSRIRRLVLDVLVQVEASIDFLEEDIEIMPREQMLETIEKAAVVAGELAESAEKGKIYREGISTAITGRPNVGKSSLLNALLREARAIVTAVPGTTRDIVEEYINIEGVPFRLRDTAGIRKPCDEVEEIGVGLSRKAVKEADIILLVLDWSEDLTREDIKIMEETNKESTIAVLNKVDLPQKVNEIEVKKRFGDRVLRISATHEKGLKELEKAMLGMILSGKVIRGGETIVANMRHKKALEKAREDLAEAGRNMRDEIPDECVAAVLKDGLDSLGEITGETIQEDLLDKIFSEFCIGK